MFPAYGKTWDETQIRRLAARLGYNLAKIMAISDRTHDPVGQLIAVARKAEADAVITPCVTHFGGAIPAELGRIAAVITVSPEHA
ncbi:MULTISPECIES: hypothetical protein [Nocardia]|uniref:Uncharacterized protein n=1 Tax=Nocardia vinacea TaxID=96468 RepID=A0ABZ1YQB4_9NOCA|nr:hypothetical protein [Nocardia vinacea]